MPPSSGCHSFGLKGGCELFFALNLPLFVGL